MSRMVSFLVLLAIIVVIGIFFYRVMASFFVPLFLAAVLVTIFRPVHEWILARLKNGRRRAALATTALILVIVLAPIITIVSLGALEGSRLLGRVNVGTLRDRVVSMRAAFGLNIPFNEQIKSIERTLDRLLNDSTNSQFPLNHDESLRRVTGQIVQLHRELLDVGDDRFTAQLVEVKNQLDMAVEAETSSLEHHAALQESQRLFDDFKIMLLGGLVRTWFKETLNPSDDELQRQVSQVLSSAREQLLTLGGATTAFLAKLIVGLLIMTVSMFFFFADGPNMIESVMALTPLDDRYEREMLEEFAKVTRSVLIATLLSAFVQGVLAGFGYYFAGLKAVFLLTCLTMICAIIPFVGSPVVWLPASLWLFAYEERPVAAVVLALYGAIVVAQIDNVIKPYILHGQARLHPLLALLSVLGGVQALGPIGVLVGPMIVVFLQTLLKILRRELERMESMPLRLRKSRSPLSESAE
ncbi:MAG: AI-2E family transporter [Pirellulaceae bacterium]